MTEDRPTAAIDALELLCADLAQLAEVGRRQLDAYIKAQVPAIVPDPDLRV